MPDSKDAVPDDAASVAPSEADSESSNKPEVVLVNRRVIDEKLIRDCVVDDLEVSETGASIKAEDVNLEEVMELSLSFKNIYAIDNLMGFEHLVKLQLDNNIIDKIQHLDHLVNLQWLDLSFNNISKIENLDKLTSLTDLSLFNNRLTTIEGLDNLTNLNVLSVGNNQIDDIECIKALRKFPNLRLLNLKGNPVYKNEDYPNFIFAYLTKLKYLDYELIESSQVVKARDSKLDQLVDLEAREKSQRAERDEQKKRGDWNLYLEEANLKGVATLLDDIIAADTEQVKLSLLTDYDARIMVEYRVQFEKLMDEFSAGVLGRHKEKVEEKSLFEEVVEKARLEAEEKSIEHIQEFEALKKKTFEEFKQSRLTGESQPAILEKLKEDVLKLSDELMDIEMILVETLNDLMDEFDEAFKRIMAGNTQAIGTTFRALGDVVAFYSSSVLKLVHESLERMSKDDPNPDLEIPALVTLLSDRESLMTSVNTSAESHVGLVMQKEEFLTTNEDVVSGGYMKKNRSDEYERNRFRVAEIHELIKAYNTTIDTMYHDSLEEDEYDYR